MSDNNLEPTVVRSPLDYRTIHGYCHDYAASKAGNETLAVIMDNSFIDAVQRFGNPVTAVFGRHANGSVTISLLALEPRATGGFQVAAAHVDGTAPGQQVWPLVTVGQFEDLLPDPR
jgi:hypothetical protein